MECTYVHPAFVALQRSFDRACRVFDLGEQPHPNPAWVVHPSVPGRKMVPARKRLFMRSYKPGLTHEDMIVDSVAKGMYPAIHTEAIDFTRHPDGALNLSECRVVAPGSFTERQRFPHGADKDRRAFNRCATLLRTDVYGYRWLDFLFLDEQPSKDLWMLCVEA